MDFTNLVVWAMIGYSAAVGKPQGTCERFKKQHLTASYECRPGQLSID